MPHLRITADRRGNENTFLMHSAAPGEPAKVIYWYRTAPGLRLGRTALDDAAMRTLEEQYPDIDFDWRYLLDVASMTPVEVEAPVPVRKRKPAPRREEADADDPMEAAPAPHNEAGAERPSAPARSGGPAEPEPAGGGYDLLAELLGRGIASSLRARHAELVAGVAASTAAPALVTEWRQRLATLDPDSWTSPEMVMSGIATVERDADALQEALDAAVAP